MSIGEVLAHLRTDFPDVTISKLRFLESEGLVEPLRTQAGYRKYSAADISRLRYVLTAQRDYYLPLRVIREQLDAWEMSPGPQGVGAGRGGPDPSLRPTPAGTGSVAAVPGPDAVDGRHVRNPSDPRDPAYPRALAAREPADPAQLRALGAREQADLRLDRSELCARAGLGEAALTELEQHGLVAPQPGGWYDADALTIAAVCRQLADYGLQPRHLRAYRVAAERELGLFAQLLAPVLHQPSPQARARAADTARELAALTGQLQAALVRAGLRSTLGQ